MRDIASATWEAILRCRRRMRCIVDNHEKARPRAGQKLKITGTLQSKSKTIHVIQIEPAD